MSNEFALKINIRNTVYHVYLLFIFQSDKTKLYTGFREKIPFENTLLFIIAYNISKLGCIIYDKGILEM